jgi:transcriptional regulator with XRE-family HTH domain
MGGGFTNNLKKEFGASVRAHRLHLGLSQERLAERAGLHRTYVTDVERGARNVSLESITRVAHALDLPVSSLFEARALAGDPVHRKASSLASILLVAHNRSDVPATLGVLRRARLANPIEVVRDGAAALDYLLCQGAFARRKKHPGPLIVLLEIEPPKRRGLEVLRLLRKDGRLAGLRVVALTRAPDDGQGRAALRLGADACLLKPFDFQAFSSVTPQLNFSWTLLHSPKGPPRRHGFHNRGLQS